MNQKITTLLGSIVILIIAVTVTYFLWLSEEISFIGENFYENIKSKKDKNIIKKPYFEDTTPVKADTKPEDIKIGDSLPSNAFEFAIGKVKEFDKKQGILTVETDKEDIKIIITESTVMYAMRDEKMEMKKNDEIKIGQEISCQYHNDPDIANRTATSVMLDGRWNI